MTSGSLWSFYTDEINDQNENDNFDNRINKNKTITSKYFEYKEKLIRNTPSNNNTSDKVVVIPLKYLSNFWRFLDFVFLYQHIYTPLQHEKALSTEIIYLLCPGVK